jgi:hypothetical protein
VNAFFRFPHLPSEPESFLSLGLQRGDCKSLLVKVPIQPPRVDPPRVRCLYPATCSLRLRGLLYIVIRPCTLKLLHAPFPQTRYSTLRDQTLEPTLPTPTFLAENERTSFFQRDVKSIDPKVFATAMGGTDDRNLYCCNY